MLVLLRKLFALWLVLGGTWLLYSYGVGHVQSDSLSKGVAVSQLRIPAYLSSDALVVAAEKKLTSTNSEALALTALSQDPANGGAAALLLSIFVAEGHEAEASTVAELAGRLWPVHTYTRSRLADYWIDQGRVNKVIPELSLLMIREPGWRNSLFPILDKLTISAGKIELLEPYITDPPNWWDDFFAYVSREFDRKVVSDLYQRRLASATEISNGESRNFVKSLLRDERWEEAFKHWQDSLGSAEAPLVSNGLFDGGFESSVINDDFGWSFRRGKDFDIATRSTYGVSGNRALALSFKKRIKRIRFQHISQRLLLKPGRYQLSYRARLDALKNPKGLVWRVRCGVLDGNLIAAGEPLFGRHHWQSRSFNFNVPKSCLTQTLALEAVSKYPHELIFSGKLWVDDVAITPLLENTQ